MIPIHPYEEEEDVTPPRSWYSRRHNVWNVNTLLGHKMAHGHKWCSRLWQDITFEQTDFLDWTYLNILCKLHNHLLVSQVGLLPVAKKSWCSPERRWGSWWSSWSTSSRFSRVGEVFWGVLFGGGALHLDCDLDVCLRRLVACYTHTLQLRDCDNRNCYNCINTVFWCHIKSFLWKEKR